MREHDGLLQWIGRGTSPRPVPSHVERRGGIQASAACEQRSTNFRVQDPRGRQRRPRAQRRAGVLVRRERRVDPGPRARRRRRFAWRAARRSAHNLGLPELREAIAIPARCTRASTRSASAVTSSGVNALMLAMQALAGAGDEVVTVVPVWLQPAGAAGDPRRDGEGPLLRSHGGTGVADRRRGCCRRSRRARGCCSSTRRTTRPAGRSPATSRGPSSTTAGAPEPGSSPTRSTSASGSAPAAARRASPTSPSRRTGLVVVHSFSKSFLMTGWRLGWLVAPQALVPAIGKLVEFNTLVRAGLRAARRAGGAGARRRVRPGARGAAARPPRHAAAALAGLPRVRVALPQGGMYAFFRVEGETDSPAFAKRLVAEAGLGLAPGSAFGDEAEGWLRWCFASRSARTPGAGVERLARALGL